MTGLFTGFQLLSTVFKSLDNNNTVYKPTRLTKMTSYEKTRLDDYSDVEELYHPPPPHGFRLTIFRLLLIVLLFVTHGLCYALGRYWQTMPAEHLKALTTWSPLHDSFPYSLHLQSLNAITWTGHPSLWRADPSDEGDKLWKQNWDSHPMLIPLHDMKKMNQDLDYVARWLDDDSMGMVGNQAHHLLHCVDVLRKAVWTDYYWPRGNLNPGHRTHQTHCVDLLRQDIMCRAPTDVYPLIWMEGESQPTPNFNISMKCSNWDGMWDWWRERQMTKSEVDRVWVKPPSVKQWPAPDGLAEESKALAEVCSRPNVTCSIDGEKVDVSRE
ncbi:Phenylalanine aminomutase (L-beta-phenylalanine forming) [Pseudocercospora fuligena]|uniref:Phenylalanine aminomutase (L-beta-phenylalanine forming) n=1 Tax=Pseudocercospora fuligena TaxID=685502 RepID=A0A8H6R9B5_9PEZI|nr:Phenylalanine aminomutase (L-beta-phenylalanine forming) [Pseudocercospora fuligena]